MNPSPAIALRSRRALLARGGLPVALGLLLLAGYAPALRSFFVSDDYVLLSEALLTRSAFETFAIDPNWWFYRPLGKLLWWLMYRVFGYHAALYHLVSLGLHWLNSLLLAALLWRLFPRAPGLAAGAGALFALNPLHVEAVAWLASLYDLLALFWYLAALLGLLLAWQQRKLAPYLCGLAAYQLCLWSKETAFTLPLLALVGAALLPERPSPRRALAAVAPFVLLLGLNLAQRLLAWGSIGGYAGAVPAAPGQRLWATALTLLAPLNRLVFPAPLVTVWLLVTAAALVAGLALVRDRRPLAFGAAWLALTLAPVFSLLPVGADLQNSRVLYLPSAGFSLALAAALAALVGRARRAGWRAPAAGAAIGGAALAATLFVQTQPWLVAGRETIHVAQELHRLIPGFPPGSLVQVQGMPDNYKGAYVYRLGLNHAFGHLYQSTFPLVELGALPPLDYTHDGNLVQVAFAFNPAAEHWQIARARAVSGPAPPPTPLAPGSQRWQLAECQAQWRLPPLSSCEPGAGVVLTPGEPAAVESPPLERPTNGWVEVEIDITVPTGAQGGEVQLLGRAFDQPWSEARAERINLPGDGSRRHYRFFLRPDGSGKSVEQLRLLANDVPSGVLVHAVSVRPIL